MASAMRTGGLHADLEALLREFAAIREDAEKLISGLSDEQFNWRPAPEKWSIGQCITHLNLIDALELPAISAAMEDARRKNRTSNGPFRYGRLSTWFIRNIEPPPSSLLRAKAPKAYVPPESQPLDDAMGAFRRVQARIIDLVGAANGLDLARVRVRTPVSRWVTFSLGQEFRLMAAHDRRHLFQAWGVRRALP
jgi:DinB superfamily